jgi:DNA-binding beta-propeller fold protein YncE
MAITINTEIIGQEATSTLTYCYIYEPLRINVIESNLLANKMYIDIEIYNAENQTLNSTQVKYADFDINSGISVSFDLMEITRQLHDSDIYKISDFSDILASNTTTSKFYYKYLIYTDTTSNPTAIQKFPLNGGREYIDFIPKVEKTQPLTEFDLYGISIESLALKFNTKLIKTELSFLNGNTFLGLSPQGITIDTNGNIYTSNSVSNNVTKITPSEFFSILGTTGTNPQGITIDTSGNIYTANATYNNVSKITPEGVSTILGTTGTNPQGITIDTSGNIYTANATSNNVSKITPEGVSTILGTTGDLPQAITIDISNNIYTANYNSNNVSKITPEGVSTILGNTEINPTAITVDSSNNIYTANYNSNNVSKITPEGVSTILGTTGDLPQAITIDSSNNIYTSNISSNNVSKITPEGVSTILGTTGTNPQGITIDTSGNIYTANATSNNVSKITPEGVSTILGSTNTITPKNTQILGNGKESCGGFIYFKSRFSGWMFWGMDLSKKNYSRSENGMIQGGLFESTNKLGGKTYVPLNYTSVSSSYSLDLKALNLNLLEMKSMMGIHSSPIVLYAENGTSRLEVMKLSSATTPLQNTANGGDFSVTLSSISMSNHQTR